MAQEEIIGKDSIFKIKDILEKHKPKSIFLVTGKGSYSSCSAEAKMKDILEGYDVVHFTDFHPNPKITEVAEGLKLFNENNCELVIAIGGGSAMDVAKGVNAIAANPCDPADFLKDKKAVENKGKPFVAVPTTSGSGSEATRFAVIYIDKTKYAISDENIVPDYAILDPVLTESLPANVTAAAGMDALGQCIESYWSIHSTDNSKEYAGEGIKLIMNSLKDAVNNPSYQSREDMAKGAHLSGKAINISRTTACHAICYPFTSYFNVPHGHGVGLTLPAMLVYNSKVSNDDVTDKRGTEYVKEIIAKITKIVGGKDPEDAAAKITQLMEDIGLKTKISEIGVKTEEDRQLILDNGFHPERVKNNPRLLTKEALQKILVNIS